MGEALLTTNVTYNGDHSLLNANNTLSLTALQSSPYTLQWQNNATLAGTSRVSVQVLLLGSGIAHAMHIVGSPRTLAVQPQSLALG